MKVFLAGETTLTRPDNPRHTAAMAKYMNHRLLSYFYHGMKTGGHTADVLETLDMGAELFLDSGAFSAFTKGVEIDIEQYAKFIRDNGEHWSVKANLDVIGDTGEASWQNLKTLESLGADVFPVFHYTDEERYLTKILDEGYEFFALGGLVGASRKKLIEWLDRIWARYLIDSDGRPRRKVHGFGLTDQVLMLRYPWYSVDSASWIFSGNFGNCLFVHNGGLMKLSFSDQSPDLKNRNAWCYQHLTPEQKTKIDKLLEECDVTADECATDYFARFVVNARAYTELGKLNAKRWVPEQEGFF